MTKRSTIKKLASATVNDPRWVALIGRDASADGRFYYSVKTTGVYCRPSCAARPARPENVQFHLTCEDAEKAGFRPCKRCKPNQAGTADQTAKKIAKVCRLIEQSEDAPSLKQLAGRAGMSTFHFHRTFKSITGLTPTEYAAAHRSKRVRASLKRSTSVTDAIYDAGFNSSGRFYENSNQVLGMTPSKFREGGTDIDIFFAIGECSLGSILVAQSKKGVCSILIGDDPDLLVRDLQDRFPKANLIGGREPLSGVDREGRRPYREARCWSGTAAGHPGHCIPATSLEGASADSSRFDRDLCRDCYEDRYAEGRARSGTGLRSKCPGGSHSVSPRHP
jgi:AraC family transcriptional regulator of adaptative response/methylated-DNA-[protein]-cysteine methyltransferase